MLTASQRVVAVLSLSLLISVGGCNQPAPTNQAGNHDHTDEPLSATAWSADLEVFAEFPHLIANHASRMVLHLTHLPTGVPVDSGTLSLLWSDAAGGTFVRTVSGPVSPGIYLVEAEVPTAGHWSLTVTPEDGGAPATLEDIHVSATSLESLHDHHHDHGETAVGEKPIAMLKEQQWRLGVAGEVVTRSTYTHTLRVAATVEAPPERRVLVTTPVAGRVSLLPHRPLPRPGQQVRAGDELLAMRVPLAGSASDLVSAEADLVRATEDLELARAEQTRARTLAEAGAAPTRRVETADAAVTAAQARQRAASRLLEGRAGEPAQVITAPIDGVVISVAAGPGQFVTDGAALLTILDPSQVWVRGHIPETALHELPPAPRARLGIHGDVNNACDIEGAELVYLAPEIDPASRTAAVVYAVDNHDGHLRPGQSLGLALDTRTVIDGLVIPTSALVDEHGFPVVFVQADGETFVKRHVTLDGQDGQLCLVREGLVAGERVVTSAAWAVKLAGADTSTPGHGHAH